jgi:hypothetical protein
VQLSAWKKGVTVARMRGSGSVDGFDSIAAGA